MKIRDGFIAKKVAGTDIVVPVGENAVSFKAIITLNESGAFLWQQLKDDITKDELTKALIGEYGIEPSIAESDVDDFLKLLEENGLLA